MADSVFSRLFHGSVPGPAWRGSRNQGFPVAAVSAPDTMRHTAQTVLGAVLDLPREQSTLLLQTLAAWRDNGGSAVATARQMFCHPNTIRQRLRKLESGTGRSLSDPQATAELFLALETTLLLPPPGTGLGG
jgi:DNA-binding PucR family transcriptional regulator